MTRLAIQEKPIDVSEAIAAVSHAGAGGVVTFLGIVRNVNEGRQVMRLEYETYASMAEKELGRIAIEIEEEIPGARVAALHRVGMLAIGDVAVACAASAPHREEAFAASRLLIDRIKERLPIWKREHYADGDSKWVACAHAGEHV
ncbi:MAG: molybdenum cofactor biosynthesis protein MoaE [Polyangiaceae bacterium]